MANIKQITIGEVTYNLEPYTDYSNAANITSGTLGNGRLPLRIQEYSTSGYNDANDATVQGWHYMTSTATNRPPFKQVDGVEGSDYRIMSTAYSASWVQQIATDFRSNDVFTRNRINGTWQPWTALVKMQRCTTDHKMPTITGNAIARWDDSRNATIKNSKVAIDDNGVIIVDGKISIGSTTSGSIQIGRGAVSSDTNSIVIGDTITGSNYSVFIGSGECDGEGVAIGPSVRAGYAGVAIGGFPNGDGPTARDYSVAIGADSIACDGSISIGTSAGGEGDNAVAIGSESGVAFDGCVAIGTNSWASGDDGSIAIGQNATAQNNPDGDGEGTGIAIGWDATAYGATAIGFSYAASEAVAINGSYATKAEAFYGGVAVGADTSAGEQGVAVGYMSQSDAGVAIGFNADSGESGIAIGRGARAEEGGHGISIGNNSTHYQGGISIGHNTVIGTTAGSYSKPDHSIAIGNGAKVYANCSASLAIGNGAIATGQTSVAIGYYAKAQSNPTGSYATGAAAGAISIGFNAVATAAQATIAIGSYAYASANQATAIGPAATGAGACTVAVGSRAYAKSSYGTAIGYNAKTNPCGGSYGTAIGYSAVANGSYGVAIRGTSHGSYSIAIGSSTVAGSSTYPTGSTAASGAYAIAIGYNITSSVSGSYSMVKIGNASYNYRYFGGTGTTWQGPSDERDKYDIQPLDDCLKMIKTLQPIMYRENPRNLYSEDNSLFNYNKEEHEKGTKAGLEYRASFRAQEVAKYMEDNYGDETFNSVVDHERYYDEDTGQNADKYFLGYGDLLPFMFQAIKEQQEIIEAQSEKINNLELRLSILEDKILNN